MSDIAVGWMFLAGLVLLMTGICWFVIQHTKRIDGRADFELTIGYTLLGTAAMIAAAVYIGWQRCFGRRSG